MIYLVAYDLNKEGQAYSNASEQLIARIKRTGISQIKIEHSVWLIATTKLSAEQVYNGLKPALDENDRIFVVKVTSDNYGWLDKAHWEWIRKYI